MDDDYQEEDYFAEANPEESEVRNYANFIGLDLDKDPDLRYIAEEGLSAALPEHWKFYRNKNDENDYFFYNSETGESIVEHPLDHYYINLAKEKLNEKYDKASKKEKHRSKKERHKNRDSTNNTTTTTTSPTTPTTPTTPTNNNTTQASHGQSEEGNVFLIDDDDVTDEEPPTLKPKSSPTQNQTQTQNSNPVVSSSPNSNLPNEEGKKKHSHSKHKSRSSTNANNAENEEEIQKQREKNDAKIQELMEEFESKKLELEREHQKIINDLKVSQRNEEQQEEDILREIQNRRKSKENELNNIDSELSMTKEQQKSQIDILKSQHEQFLDTLKKQNNDEIDLLKKTFENTINQMKEDQKTAIDELKQKHANEINKLKNDQLKEKSDTASQFKAEIAEMKKQHKNKIEKMRAKHERQINEIKMKAANHLEEQKKKYDVNNQPYPNIVSSSPSKNILSPMSNISHSKSKPSPIRETRDYKKESMDAINRFDEYTKNELDKRRREYEIQLSKLMAAHSEEMARKNAEHINLVKNLDEIKEKYNEEIRKAQENADNEKRNIFKQMQKDVSLAKQKEIKEKKRFFVCQTQRIVSIRGKDSYYSPTNKTKLKRSKALFLNVENYVDFRFSPPHTIFQIYPKSTPSLPKDKSQVFDQMKSDSSDDERYNKDLRKSPNQQQGSNSNGETFVEISENKHQQIKYSFQKVQQQFDANAKKMENKMDNVLSDINGQVKDLRSFMQEENRFMNKSTLEFHQQILDITRNFHNSLSELETEHFSAVSTMNSIKNKAENIPQQIIVAPPMSPQPYFSYLSPGGFQQDQYYKRPRRYNRYDNVRESESYYDSD